MKILTYNCIRQGFVLLALGVGLLVASCQEDTQTLPALDVDKADFAFEAIGGEGELAVLSAGEWTAKSDADWLRISPANGVGKTNCQLLVDASYAYTDRKASLQIQTNGTTQTITVAQKGFPKQITLSATQVELADQDDPTKMFFEVEVLANVPWRMLYDQSEYYWITYKATVNTGSAKPVKSVIRFAYDINAVPAARSVDINFEAVNGDVDPVKLNISQKAAPLIEPSRRGDSLAVVAMVRSLNAYYMDISKRMEFWNGVVMENDRIVELDFQFINTKRSLPYEVQYLTELRKLSVRSNSNSFLRRIKLGPEISKLKKLEELSLFGYGISELDESIATLPNLRVLDLNGNTFNRIPIEILQKMPALKVLDFGGNRRWDGIYDLSAYTKDKADLGLHGAIPQELFEMEQLEELTLTYNYFEGSIPDSKCGMPNLKVLKVNLNKLTGDVPQWILNHSNVCDWIPYIFIFKQEGRDSNGVNAGFNNEPKPEDICPLTGTATN